MRAGNALLDARAVFAALHVPRGAHIVDLGTGNTGHFALHAAEAVGHDGRVYAVDILKSALAMLASSAALRGMHTLRTLWGDIERPHGVALPDDSVDYALFVHVLHALRQEREAVREACRLVKPGGSIIVIDWHPNTSHPLALQVPRRINGDAVDALFHAEGCDCSTTFVPSPAHWGRVYQVPRT